MSKLCYGKSQKLNIDRQEVALSSKLLCDFEVLFDCKSLLLFHIQRNFLKASPGKYVCIYSGDGLAVSQARSDKESFYSTGLAKAADQERELCENFPNVKQYAELLSSDNF